MLSLIYINSIWRILELFAFYRFSFSVVISFSIYISVRHSFAKSSADIGLVWIRIEELLIDVCM